MIRGFNKLWHKWVVQRNRRVLFWKGFLLRGVREYVLRGNFEIGDSCRRIFLHFEVYFYFALLFLEVNQFDQIWREKNILLKSMHCFLTKKKGTWYQSLTTESWPLQCPQLTFRKNCYCSISLNLMPEQNIPITITTWQTLLFILGPSFLWCFLLPVGLIGLCFTFCSLKAECLSVSFDFCFP